jgi:hypothetical protein
VTTAGRNSRTIVRALSRPTVLSWPAGVGPVSTRVLATQAALRAATQLEGRLGSLGTAAQHALALGQTLADPNAWDGPAAARFRGGWQQTGGAVRQVLQQVEGLQRTAREVIGEILAAGNEGLPGGPGPGGPGTGASPTSPFGQAYTDLRYVTGAWGIYKAAKVYSNLGKMVETFRSWPETARQIYGESVGETALAFDRGEATLAQLEEASATAMRSVEAGEVFSKVGAMRDVASPFTGGLDVASRAFSGIAVAGDVYTIINPGRPGGEGTALQVAAGANAVGTIAALGVINASVDWIPVAGQVVAVSTGLFLAGDWAYHNIPAFHGFADTVGHGAVAVAEDTWRGVEDAGGAVGHFFSSIF